MVAAAVAVLSSWGLSGCELQPNDNTLPGQVAVGDDGLTVTVYFDQVENLVANSSVLQDNVVIGTVADIAVEDWRAKVELRLLEDVPVPADSLFSIGQKTLLGAQYVEVSSRTSPTLAATDPVLQDGDVVPADQTGTYPATEQVLGAVALLLNNGGLSQISTITSELSTALDGRVPDARGLIKRTNELLAVLDENRGDVVAALESLDRLSSGLADDRERLGDAVDRIAPGLQALEEERVRLVGAVTTTGRAGDRAVGVIHASRRALLANLESLQPILTNLGKVSEQLPEALKLGLTIPFPAMTTTNALKGDYANLFTTLDLTSTSLAASWLGGLPPAMQFGDPIENPLLPGLPLGGSDGAAGSTGPGSADPGGGQGGTPPSAAQGPDSCALSFLGVC